MSSTELYRIFAQNIPEAAVFVYDHDLRYLIAEGPELEYAGYGRDAIEGRTLYEVLPQETADFLLPYYQAALSGQDVMVEANFPQGVYRMRFVPIFDEERGRVESGMVVAQNISEIRYTQAELSQRINQLTILGEVEAELDDKLDDAYVLNLALDAALRLSEAEAGYIAVMEGDELRLARWVGNYDPNDLTAMLRKRKGAIGRVLESGEAEWIVDVRDDPDYVPLIPRVVSRIVVPMISQEHIVGVLNLETLRQGIFHLGGFEFIKLMAARIAVALDNARLYRKTTDQLAELQSLYTKVYKLEQLKTDMIRIAAHDLRNPLAAVMGYLELLTGHLKKNTDATALGYLDEASKGAGRMRKIMTDILSLERIEAAAANPRMELFDLRMIVRAVFDEQLFGARTKNQHFTLDAAVPPLVIEGDSAQLREAISNLVNNAIKYTPENGTICVMLRVEDRLIVFEVEDNGYGVREDQQDRLFEPFFRAKSIETRDIEGTGLGLHLVKNIIERHGGKMRFKSQYQKGSTFGFELPMPSGMAD